MPTITAHYSEPLIRRVVRAFWWRTTGWLYFTAMALLAVSLGFAVWRGDRSWWVGLLGGVLLLGNGLAAAVFLVHFRGSMARLRRMQVPEATIELGEQRIHIRSDAGAAELPWTAVTEVWTFPDFWLLFLSRSEFFTLPTADLDAAAREFILAKAGAHRVKVT